VVHDGCHGYDFHAGEIRLSVLRSAAYCHEQGFKIEERPARKFMDQGVHEVRVLVLAGDPQAVRASVSGLADWLTAPPAVYSHLPIGRVAGEGPTTSPALLQISPSSLRLLACKQSSGGKALIARLQEMTGKALPANLQLAGMTAPVKLTFKPYELKTLRFDRNGTSLEAGLLTETAPTDRHERQ
jgi:alpha-mannosidase